MQRMHAWLLSIWGTQYRLLSMHGLSEHRGSVVGRGICDASYAGLLGLVENNTAPLQAFVTQKRSR